uniref:Plethodontid modulating factor n=1 Tax=Plethodon shermani TaxID=263671 RepID=Q0GB74_9SALA
MRSTVLLIFLAVFVSKGKSLQCYAKNALEDGIVTCPTERDNCIIIKTSTRDYKACASHEFCEKFPELVNDPFEIHRCCQEDLCN